MAKSDSKIKLGNVSLDDSVDDTDPRNEKLRITTWIDGDIYNELKRRADAGDGNGKYQTLMNDLLRKALFKHSAETAFSGTILASPQVGYDSSKKSVETTLQALAQQLMQAIDGKIESQVQTQLKPLIKKLKKPGA